MAKQNKRIDHQGPHRSVYEKNRRYILATQEICGICGRPVDKSREFPDPLAPVIDHIIPIDQGGHPSDIDNLQLAHNMCNRQKSNKIKSVNRQAPAAPIIPNNVLPHSIDWKNF